MPRGAVAAVGGVVVVVIVVVIVVTSPRVKFRVVPSATLQLCACTVPHLSIRMTHLGGGQRVVDKLRLVSPFPWAH